MSDQLTKYFSNIFAKILNNLFHVYKNKTSHFLHIILYRLVVFSRILHNQDKQQYSKEIQCRILHGWTKLWSAKHNIMVKILYIHWMPSQVHQAKYRTGVYTVNPNNKKCHCLHVLELFFYPIAACKGYFIVLIGFIFFWGV